MASPTINDVFVRNVYPGLSNGPSVGIAATAPSGHSAANSSGVVSQGNSDPAVAASIGSTGHAFGWWVALLVMLFALMYGAKHLGSSESGNFSNIKPSVYNVVIIAWAAIIGSAILKVAFSKVKVPGLSTVILAS